MNLTDPITITPPSITRQDGSVRNFNPITLNNLDVTIIDSVERKNVIVQIRPLPMPLVLWEGESYTTIGDYTQAEVEARIIELLGNEPSKVLQSLFSPPVRPIQ
jgi:hypothetical protein